MSKDKKHRIKVSYAVTLSSAEYRALVELGREWGFGCDNKIKPLRIAKMALENSGVSGCLGELHRLMNPPQP